MSETFYTYDHVRVLTDTSGYPFSDGRPLTRYFPMDNDFGVTGIDVCRDDSTGLFHLVPRAWLTVETVTTPEEQERFDRVEAALDTMVSGLHLVNLPFTSRVLAGDDDGSDCPLRPLMFAVLDDALSPTDDTE